MKPRHWLCSSVAAVAIVVTLSAQTLKPAFEVASVKKVDSSGPLRPTRLGPQAPMFYVANATLAYLIRFAYNILDSQLIGGPAWIRRDQFEINARAATEVSNDEQRPMVQSLLEERFRLMVHKEVREMRFFTLSLARDDGRPGPGLRQCGNADAPERKVVWPRGGILSARRCVPLSELVDFASGTLKIPVIDNTGLAGLWSYELTYADPQPLPQSAQRDADANLASFPDALKEQLGLKLESREGPVDVLVIDSVQQPTEN